MSFAFLASSWDHTIRCIMRQWFVASWDNYSLHHETTIRCIIMRPRFVASSLVFVASTLVFVASSLTVLSLHHWTTIRYIMRPLFVTSWDHYSLHHETTIRCIMRPLFVASSWKHVVVEIILLSMINYLNLLESKFMYLLIVMSHDKKWKIFWLQ